ncbi:malate dehydrogenase [Hibiscus syriacus]|uniref:Malate dehydrogenase n=1 Tax=Hibiscus syriacus TaxID=106335 RepID=A0A6A3BWY6_HIBSY|nr:malate dehydrogenase [Hibiscus syriacus]
MAPLTIQGNNRTRKHNLQKKGSSTSHTARFPLPQTKPFTARFTSQNSLASFSGLKAATYVKCESESSFLGTERSATLRGLYVPKAQIANLRSQYGLQPVASYKVAILGAAGWIGSCCRPQSLYTPPQVQDFTGASELGNCLKGVNVVVIPAGVPRKPGMTRDDLFNINANIVKTLVDAVADNCPDAFIHIISNPVNSTVPIAAEVLKQKGVYDPKKLFGVTTLDVVRANTFFAEKKNLKLIDVDVPVVGGLAGITILPLLSKTKPSVSFTDEEVEQLTVRIQNAGTEVVEAKASAGSATLSMAYAASDLTDLPFFTSRIKLGTKGVEALIPSDLSGLSEYEEKALEALKPELKASIEKGIAFVQKQLVTA